MSRPEWPLAVCLAIGLLIGLERERRNGDGSARSAAGLLGGVAALVSDTGFVLLSSGFVALGSLTAYGPGDCKDPGLTGRWRSSRPSPSAFWPRLGPPSRLKRAWWWSPCWRFGSGSPPFVRDRITDQELLGALTFAIAAVVIIPLLPNCLVDPFGLLNLFTIWRLGVVAIAIRFLGYVAQGLLGERYGLLAAGLVSNTAAVAAMGARAQGQPNLT